MSADAAVSRSHSCWNILCCRMHEPKTTMEEGALGHAKESSFISIQSLKINTTVSGSPVDPEVLLEIGSQPAGEEDYMS